MVHVGRNVSSEQLKVFREHEISKRFAVVMQWRRGPSTLIGVPVKRRLFPFHQSQ